MPCLTNEIRSRFMPSPSPRATTAGTVTVNDGNGGPATTSFTWTVTDVNRAPAAPPLRTYFISRRW